MKQPRQILGVGGATSWMRAIVKMRLDIEGHRETMWAYELEGDDSYDLILGRPWIDRSDTTIASKKKSLYIHSSGTRVRSKEGLKTGPMATEINAAAFSALYRRAKTDKKIRLYAASMADIEKALKKKKKGDPREKLPEYLQSEAAIFSREEADRLAPHRGPGIDHSIEVVEKDGKQAELPWGPLYNMGREELLVLRKELTSYLDRGFIRVSRSSASAPVLFAKKPGGGLRFCVDYRALNAITRKDRYPLPLIRETLSQISEAQWFTKVDVIQAFHKIRIAEGEEWKTAFRTRFGLYEWLVTPFGLANAPSTFQRYINWVLREHLDEDCSAYMDDVLIYAGKTRKEHEKIVKTIIRKLGAAGLHLDVDKSEFSVKKTKYLGFIIEAGVGVSMDPAKVEAIKAWERPQSVKGIRSFVGFANFYRQFIKNFSSIVEPLTRLTGKDSKFAWGQSQEEAFNKLKEAFIAEPALANFDPDLETIMECDASGWSIGGVLSQYGKDGLLHAVAYFSAKNTTAEVNYTIHDKELLAVIKCLEQWSSELKRVQSFTVITDHKNLEYFCTTRLLSERHVRWASLLSQFNMTFLYRPGNVNSRADALSRKEQDLPKDATDVRLKTREFQLLQPVQRRDPTADEEEAGASFCFATTTATASGSTIPSSSSKHVRHGNAPIFPECGILSLQETDRPQPHPSRVAIPTTAAPAAVADDAQCRDDMWKEAEEADDLYRDAKAAVMTDQRKFPPSLNLKVSRAECSLDELGRLTYRHRKWVPNSPFLRTRIIADTHESTVAGHPGREATYAILARNYFWPGMSSSIRQFVQNCDICGRTKPWRELKRGLLRPLPIPDRIWKEISMDFIVGLPSSDDNRHLMVVTCRLSKAVILIPLKDLETETVADAFIERVVAYHWLPDAIVSDRGGQFVSDFWTTMCNKLGITRRLSTAWHPQTDGSTERMNSVVEAYLRAFVDWSQSDWSRRCPAAQIAINGRNAASTGVSPFFLQHGYDTDPVQEDPDLVMATRDRVVSKPDKAAEAMVEKFKATFDFVQSKMAEAQQEQERQANKHRQEAPLLRKNDVVWLQYGKQLSNGRPSKKLDWRNAKFKVVKVISPHAVELDTPPGIHPVFHVDKLRLHPNNPLPGQTTNDWQPEAIEVEDGTKEWLVEDIVGERIVRRGRGKKKQYLVKWMGHLLCSWEPAEELEDVAALDTWTAFSSAARDKNGLLPQDFRKGDPAEPKRK